MQELVKALSQQENKPGSDAQKLADFYRAGIDTLTRNKRGISHIGDLCGVTVDYQAFKKTAQGKGNQLIDGLTPDQRFFLAYAATWRTKQREQAVRT